MTSLLSSFAGTPVLVVGDLMLDEFIWGDVSRISPEAPVPVVEVRRRSFTAGGAANTAANVAALGGQAYLAGVVGDDSDGNRICSILDQSDCTAVVRDPQRPTTTKTRVVAHSQQVVRIDHEQPGPLSKSIENELLERILGLLPKVRACVVSDYGKGVVTRCLIEQVIASARTLNVGVIVDPKGTDYEKYRGATIVKPNQLEAGKVLNRELRTNGDVDRAGADLMELLGPGTSVLITRGPQGMSLFEPGRDVVHIPAQAREVYDVTGAGDTVACTMALTLAVGGNLPTACTLASLAAAIVVGKVGTATCSLQELLNAAESKSL